MSSYIIAGIDPGSTTGIAILDLSGKRIAALSTTGGISDAVRIIERHGTPSLLACDVSPLPDAVRRAASYFSCRAFCPAREIREEEKKRVASGAQTCNSHERDAYCAAVLAYRASANRLRQIDALSDFPQEERERLKHMFLRGYRLRDAVLSLHAAEKAGAAEEAPGATSHPAAPPQELRQRISVLARENANLRMMLSRLEGEKQQLLSRMVLLENGVRRSILRDSEVRRLRHKLQWSANRRSLGRKSRLDAASAPSAKGEDALNRLGGPKLDLEKMVTEYRRGRRQFK